MSKKLVAVILSAIMALGACVGCKGSLSTSITSTNSEVPESSKNESSTVSTISKAESSVVSQTSKLESSVTSEEVSDLETYQFDENNKILYSESKENGKTKAIVICSFDGKDKEREFVRITIISMCLKRKYSDFMIMVTSGDEYGNYSWTDGEVDKTLSIPVESYSGLKPDINNYLDEYAAINNANILGTKGYDLEEYSSENSKSETSKEDSSNSVNKSTNKIIYDKNNVKISYKGIEDKDYRKDIKLYIENNLSYDVIVQIDNFSINGYMLSPLFSANVDSGKKINKNISIYSDELEENDITEIKNIELKFVIFDTNDYSKEIKTETIKFSVS